ncbi:MAG: efflux RND transporter periplasmic adaptor subunit [Bacteroidetes bacterium]|nr:MAG: efflux RND transporter periplasmic adaptor subunit [Bacteroidota bacterium]
MNNIIFIAALATSLVFASCNSNKTDIQEKEAEHHDEHENTNTATLTAEQMKSIKIELGSIEKKQLTASLKANGLLRVPNDNKANATTLFGGVVKTLLVQIGNTVSKGQVIATIGNTNFITMQEELLNTTAKLELAILEFERQKTLKEGNATALKTFQIAETELKTLQAKRASLESQLHLAGINTQNLSAENIQSVINVISPINGTVSDISVNIGSYANANTSIAEIVDNNQLHLDLYVYEKDLQKLKVGQTIHFTLTNNPGKEYDADVYAISNTFEQNTKAVAVHAMVKGNKQGLIDGMSITALVSLENATVDAVPTNAIVNHEGQDYIFIVTDAHKEEEHHGETETAEHKHDEHGHEHSEKEEPEHKEEGTTFEKIPIRKGTTDVGYSEITLLKEIPANSKVVVNGAFFILAKMNNKGEAHAH